MVFGSRTVSPSERVVMLDGDTVLEPNTIAELAQPFADPAVGAVAGNVKVTNRQGLLGGWQHVEYVIGFSLDRRLYDVLHSMPTVPGAVGAFRTDAVRQAGGVPLDTLAEDTDLTMALQRAGWSVKYQASARAWTEAPQTLRQLWRQRHRWSYGVMQAMWKHRGSVLERGMAGRLGRRGLLDLMLFQVLLPVLAPAIDVFVLLKVFSNPLFGLRTWLGFVVIQLVPAMLAFRLDREPLRTLWSLVLQIVVYRQLMYLVVIRSVIAAIAGTRLRWHKIPRLGSTSPFAALAIPATRRTGDRTPCTEPV
jgi:cellulose synthase/poly-beta-1,6-N-acetylglucosamine synthase-like glycosyltransferase